MASFDICVDYLIRSSPATFVNWRVHDVLSERGLSLTVTTAADA